MSGRSYDRKLENVLAVRLQAGQDPDALLAELKTRLDADAAEAVLSRAEARVSGRPQATPAARIMAGVAYAWVAVLVAQNLIILSGLLGLSPRFGLGSLLPNLVIFPLLKVGLLCAGLFAFKTRRTLLTTILFAAAILYAFPLGLMIEGRISEFATPADGWVLLSVSALLSYATVAMVGLVFWLGRRRAPSPAPAAIFD